VRSANQLILTLLNFASTGDGDPPGPRLFQPDLTGEGWAYEFITQLDEGFLNTWGGDGSLLVDERLYGVTWQHHNGPLAVEVRDITGRSGLVTLMVPDTVEWKDELAEYLDAAVRQLRSSGGKAGE
jgi:hypothetical protein